MFFRIILWSIVIVVVLRFITRFLFPLLNITKAVTHKMREMQAQMDRLNQQQQQQQRANTASKKGEYIDYEEVK
jgi:hypothetical protein